MRFPSTAPYRGIAVIFHGFTSCPQEMALLGPPLAAEGYDVLMPLNEGHGFAFTPDNFNAETNGWLLGMGIISAVVALCSVCAASVCSCCCDGRQAQSARRILLCVVTALLLPLLALLLVRSWHPEGVATCISMSARFGCGGQAERNRGLPTDAASYEAFVEQMNAIARLASGERVVTGLSLGGGLATYAGLATDAAGAPLYARSLAIAPFYSTAFDPLLGPLMTLGLGKLTIDWGDTCDDERRLGRAGYCTFHVVNILAARNVGRNAARLVKRRTSDGTLPPGMGLLLNRDDPAIVNSVAANVATASDMVACLLQNPAGYHSYISTWNNAGVDKWWISEEVCRVVGYLSGDSSLGVTSELDAALGFHLCASACDGARQPPKCKYDCGTDTELVCPFAARRRRAAEEAARDATLGGVGNSTLSGSGHVALSVHGR
jgi:hypothetical protein